MCLENLGQELGDAFNLDSNLCCGIVIRQHCRGNVHTRTSAWTNCESCSKEEVGRAQNRMKTTVQNYDAYGVPRILEYLKLVSYHVTFD